jgi:hypothetical protein
VNLPVQEIFTCCDSRTHPLSYSRISQIPEVRGSAGSWLRVFGFESLRIRDLEASQVQDSKPSRVHDSEASRVRDSRPPRIRTPRLREFQTPDPHDFFDPENIFTNFMNLDVSRVTGFPEFPNSSPSGKRVDSDDRIPRTFQNFSQKRHPRNVGGDTRHPETSQWSNQGAFAELPLLAHINRRLTLSKFFSPFSCFVANCISLLRGNSLRSSVCGFKFSPDFSKVLFFFVS